MPNILVVDEEHRIRDRIVHFFQGNGHAVLEAAKVADAVQILEDRNIEVIVIDTSVSHGTINDVLRITQLDYEHTQVIATSDAENLPKAVMAVREGAFDYLQKPYSVAELYLKVEKALEVRRLKLETQNLRGEQPFIYRVNEFIGNSPQIKELLKSVGKIARSDASVVLSGENGTGKELVGGLIHYNSYRKRNAFVRVNCASLSDDLLEKELFGHERDAFVGAEHLRIGKLEQADGGSIFLDEITDMSFENQKKLLHFFETGSFMRMGSNHPIFTNVRVIASSSKDIKAEIEKESFLENLYYHLHVVSLYIPPLRERREDIFPLVQFYLKKYAPEFNKKIIGISPEALEMLYAYAWPGNVRELRNCIERAVLFAESEYLELNDFNLEPQLNVPLMVDTDTFGSYNLEAIERQVIHSALKDSDYIQKNAAELLGISRRALNYKIQKYGLRHHSWRRNA